MKSELREFLGQVRRRMQSNEEERYLDQFSTLICDYLDAQDEKLMLYEDFLRTLKTEAARNSAH